MEYNSPMIGKEQGHRWELYERERSVVRTQCGVQEPNDRKRAGK